MTSTGRLCQHIKADGSPCGATPMRDSAFCYFHAPETAARRAESRVKGGKARHGRQIGSQTAGTAPVTLQTPADVLGILETELNAVLGLERSLSRARTVAALLTVGLKVIEITEIAARLAALEAAVFHQGVNR